MGLTLRYCRQRLFCSLPDLVYQLGHGESAKKNVAAVDAVAF
jgi:hypothetical protein